MLDINPLGKKTILSIDGGGMRGTIVIAMLAELEAMTGKPAYELFDMVAGTSTGAIIAAGLAAGISAERILNEVYLDRLPAVFRKQRNIWQYPRYLLNGLRNLYDYQPFIDALSPFVGSRKIGDLTKPIVLMTAKDLRTSNTYYIVSAGPGRDKFKDWPLVGATAASGAAPIYFPPVKGDLVDGGVGAYSNPCLVASIEAMEYIGAAAGFSDNNVIHYSIGTGSVSNATAPGAGRRFWLYDWIVYIIAEGLDDSGLQQVLNTNAIYSKRIDFRRYNVRLDAASLRDNLDIDTRSRPNPAKLDLDSAEPDQVALMAEIGRKYAHIVNWTEPGYMPWVADRADPNYGKGRDGGQPLPTELPVDWSGGYI